MFIVLESNNGKSFSYVQDYSAVPCLQYTRMQSPVISLVAVYITIYAHVQDDSPVLVHVGLGARQHPLICQRMMKHSILEFVSDLIRLPY